MPCHRFSFSRGDTMPEFNVVRLEGADLHYERQPDGSLMVFADGKSAASWCQTLYDSTGFKYQPRPVSTGDWKQREYKRLCDGTYTAVPWADEPWFVSCPAVQDHFVHVAIGNPGLVAFTENPQKGENDIQTRMRAGRYLEKFCTEAIRNSGASRRISASAVKALAGKMCAYADSPCDTCKRYAETRLREGGVNVKDTIKDISTEYTVLYQKPGLQFATNADDMVDVYQNGTYSCMQYRNDAGEHYAGPVHPVSTYDAGDLQVAYIMREGVITGRAVVWPAKMTHSRIYGDEARMGKALHEAGYRFAPPYGAKLKLVRHTNPSFVVAPYIDKGCSSGQGAINCRIEGEYLIVAWDGEVQCNRTDGLGAIVRANREECYYCHDTYRRESMYEVRTDRDDWDCVCEDCRDDHYESCSHTGAYVHTNDLVQVGHPDDPAGTLCEINRWDAEQLPRCHFSALLIHRGKRYINIKRNGAWVTVPAFRFLADMRGVISRLSGKIVLKEDATKVRCTSNGRTGYILDNELQYLEKNWEVVTEELEAA
jgi:hypothetical protein